VPGRPEMTAFRRRLRYHQAQWREAHGHPIGSQPILPRPGKTPTRPVGSRLPLDYANRTGANFLTEAARHAATARTNTKEPHQTFDRQRVWADLLWSPTLAFNLFGDLAADLALADQAVHAWWPDAPGTVSEVRFAYSPGRLDPAFLGSLVAFDAAFVLDLGDGTHGVIGIDVKYHDIIRRHEPKPARLPRYVEVADTSRAFGPDAIDAVNGTDLLLTWLEHLLVHSMLQHPSGQWRWGRYAVIHPAGSPDCVDAYTRYQALLTDQSTFASTTLEQLLDNDNDALPAATAAALRDRYLLPA
jgi:hypothetical protein